MDRKKPVAVEIFSLVKRSKSLPTKIEDLVPLSFVGQTAVKFYQEKLKLMDQLGMAEEQRQVTLRDGQDAGGLLLDIEARIGELAKATPRASTTKLTPQKGPDGRICGGSGSKPSGEPPKHERLGLTERKMQDALTIAKHPEIVEKAKAWALENDEIPTKSMVLAEVRRTKKEEERKKNRASEDDMAKLQRGLEEIGKETLKLSNRIEVVRSEANRLNVSNLSGLGVSIIEQNLADLTRSLKGLLELFGYEPRNPVKGAIES